MSSRVIQSKHIYDAGFHEFYTYGTGALNSNIGISISVQAMTIKNGNVGIGTANPTQKLHIEGSIFAKGNVTCSNINVIGDFVTLNTITSNTEQVVIENAGTGPALKVTQTGNNSVAEFYDKESGLAMIVGEGGNIGIGANNPQVKLYIYEPRYIDVLRVDNDPTRTGVTGPFIIDKYGNVGIGLGTPISALHVEGGVSGAGKIAGIFQSGKASDKVLQLKGVSAFQTGNILEVYQNKTSIIPDIVIDGTGVNLGNGVLTKDCYFSNDGGITPKLIKDIEAGDILYWNGANAGYELDPLDDIDFEYEASNLDL